MKKGVLLIGVFLVMFLFIVQFSSAGIFNSLNQQSQPPPSQTQTICCMKTQTPIQPISITASAIKQVGETYKQFFTKIFDFLKNLF